MPDRECILLPGEQQHGTRIGTAKGMRGVRSADVNGVGQLIEWPAEPGQRRPSSEVDRPASIELRMIDGLRHPQQPVALYSAAGPAGRLGGELVEQGECPLATAVADGVGQFAPRHEEPVTQCPFGSCDGSRLPSLVHGPVTDQVGDVRNDPVLARLDEPVFVELLDIVLDDVGLLGDDPKQAAERLARLGVADTDIGRQQIVEAVEVAAHDCTSRRMSVSGTSGSSKGDLCGERGLRAVVWRAAPAPR